MPFAMVSDFQFGRQLPKVIYRNTEVFIARSVFDVQKWCFDDSFLNKNLNDFVIYYYWESIKINDYNRPIFLFNVGMQWFEVR